MSYSDPFDVTTPSGGQNLALGDDRLRELKRALSQRLSTFFSNWPDGDPLTPKNSASAILVGVNSARPNPPSASNLIYWAYDVDRLYVSIPGTPPVWDGPLGGGTASTANLFYARFSINEDLDVTGVGNTIIAWDFQRLHIGNVWSDTDSTFFTIPEGIPDNTPIMLDVSIPFFFPGNGDSTWQSLSAELERVGTLTDVLAKAKANASGTRMEMLNIHGVRDTTRAGAKYRVRLRHVADTTIPSWNTTAGVPFATFQITAL